VSYLDQIRACNDHDLGKFRPFRIAGQQVGWVRHDFAGRLAGFPEVFRVSDAAVELAPELAGVAARTAAVEPVLRRLDEAGLAGRWRDERYPVAPLDASPHAGGPVSMHMERAAIPLFGVRAYGEHLNGWVRRRDGLYLWVARRAADKPTYPGMLDNTVAGGQPVGLGLKENLIKECWEEAGIPRALAEQAVPVGAISYVYEGEGGLKPDLQYCFDLELPEDFVPRNRDGEIADFYLWPIDRVAETVRDGFAFKFNCNLVIIDFLVRHGVIGPDDPDYSAITHGLRR
jgi:8-oxo-dGTP pyrophosphatase MutT (NUDIX family)